MRRWILAGLLTVALAVPAWAVDISQYLRFAVRNKWVGQPATAQGTVPTAGVVPFASGLAEVDIVAAYLQNRAGGAAPVALVLFIKDASWVAGQWVHATTTFTADTTDAQDAGTDDFPLETTTVNDGFIVGSRVQFGAVSLDVTTAGSGTSPTHVLEYWDGSAWTAVAAVGHLIDIARSADWAAGEAVILFEPPSDWAQGGSGTGVPQSYYNIRVRRTNATQATAAVARRIYIGQIFLAQDAVAANGILERQFEGGVTIPARNEFGGLGAVFGTADEGNTVELVVRYR